MVNKVYKIFEIMDNLLTRKEAMQYLRIKSPTTFKKYVDEGLIKPLKPNKRNVTNRKRYNQLQLDKVFI